MRSSATAASRSRRVLPISSSIGPTSRKSPRRRRDRSSCVPRASGPNIEVLIDVHANFNVASAIRAANRLEEFDITWFEEPVQPESYQALRQVKENVRVPICVGHGSWLNMAEIENSVLSRQCLARRIPDIETLGKHISPWETERNARRDSVNWRFNVIDARGKLQRLYPQLAS